VSYILELRAGGVSYNKIALRLTAEGHASRRGRYWKAMSVRSVVRTAARLKAVPVAV